MVSLVRLLTSNMAHTIPTREPLSFVQSETVTWTKSLSDYPPGTWTLTYALVLAGSSTAQKLITATDNGDGTHLATILDTDSANYGAGNWRWQSKVTDGTSVYALESGTIAVETSFADASSGYDDRSHAKKMVDAYEILILAKASEDVSSYSTPDGVSLSKVTHEELRNELAYWERMYQQEQAQERIDLGFGNPRKVRTRFMGRR